MMIDPNGNAAPPVMPSNAGAEQVLLGVLLRDNGKLPEVAGLLAPDRFSDPIHGVIYLAIRKVVDAGMVADVAVIRAEFEDTGLLDEVGGTAYLGQLVAQGVPAQVSIRNYAESIHDAWLRRTLIDVAEHLHALAADTLQSAYGGCVSEFGDAPGTEQANFVAARLRGLLALVEAAAGKAA